MSARERLSLLARPALSDQSERSSPVQQWSPDRSTAERRNSGRTAEELDLRDRPRCFTPEDIHLLWLPVRGSSAFSVRLNDPAVLPAGPCSPQRPDHEDCS
ncbi:unnamed protein product [Knipowitschia caucasica]|uniref:Uncharacterized protein n=1 Tax=Knipowitschia caucasica TaxID=637954 RepID=A0AAV2K0S4_KNICA